jgi:tryptophan 2,3-dioxygenase
MLKPPMPTAPDMTAKLEAELARPTLYDEALRHLARQGLPVPAHVLTRDLRQTWVAASRGSGGLGNRLPRPAGALAGL